MFFYSTHHISVQNGCRRHLSFTFFCRRSRWKVKTRRKSFGKFLIKASQRLFQHMRFISITCRSYSKLSSFKIYCLLKDYGTSYEKVIGGRFDIFCHILLTFYDVVCVKFPETSFAQKKYFKSCGTL